MIERIAEYKWATIGGVPKTVPLDEWRAFTTVTRPSAYADICGQEQRMADTLQQYRLVAMVDDQRNVTRYYICEPNPNSAHRIKK